MLSSRRFSTPRTINPKIVSTSSRTGKKVPIQMDGLQAGTWVSIEDAREYAKWAGKRASPRVGGAGTPRRATMGAAFPGETAIGWPPHGAAVQLPALRITMLQRRFRIRAARCFLRAMWMGIPRGQSVWRTGHSRKCMAVDRRVRRRAHSRRHYSRRQSLSAARLNLVLP